MTATDDEIRALRNRSEESGDVDLVKLCDRALGWIVSSSGMRRHAREVCDAAINPQPE